MKYNIIFSGLPESHDRQSENYKQVLKEFISKDLVIEDDIEFQNVHRQRQRGDRKPRSIIPRFMKYSDHQEVLNVTRYKLRDIKNISATRQKLVIGVKNYSHNCTH